MRGLTTEELEVEQAEELPARELMGSAGTMPASHLPPAMPWHAPGSHETWQDVGPQFYSMK